MVRIIDKRIDLWLNQYPESFHPYDMERFYKMVYWGYKRVPTFSGYWLRSEIIKRHHGLSDKNIQYYCEQTDKFIDFCKANFPKPPSKEQIEYDLRANIT